jgi:hypothetical protein
MTDLAQLVHERVKRERPEQSGPVSDFDKLQAEEAEKFATKLNVDVLGVQIVFEHLCENCRQRAKNLALEIAGRYGEVQPANPRKSKQKDGELPLSTSSTAAS